MKVAVLMTCFNRREVTLQCLRCLSAQLLDPGVHLEVFLVDDGSTDGTGDAVRAAFPDVHVLRGTGSLYWTGGMAAADAAAWPTRPDYLLWLNDDVALEPNALCTLLGTAGATGDSAVIVGSTMDAQTHEGTYGGYLARDRRRPLALDRVEPSDSVQFVDTMNGNVVLVPRRVREVVGPLETRFTHNMADMDYAFRARAEGFTVAVAPGFAGTCARNHSKDRWRDAGVPLRKRLRAVCSHRGLPPKQWWVFTRRYCGWRWPRYFVSPYFRALFPGFLGGRTRRRPAGAGISVVHLLGPLMHSGAERMLACAAEDFRSLGVHSVVLSMARPGTGTFRAELQAAGFEVNEIDLVSWPRFFHRYVAFLRSQRPDVVHIHPEQASALTPLIPRLLGIRVVRTVHSSFGFAGVLRARKVFERLIARAVGVQFVSISPSVQANELLRFRNPTTLIMNWFDDCRFRLPSDSERASARDFFQLADRDFAIAVVGNCSAVKNHATLLRAMALIPGRHVVLLHAGEGTDTVEEINLAEELLPTEAVRFLGTLGDVRPVLFAADGFVMPSLYEGLPIAALEAIATGLPAVVTDAPGLRDLAAVFVGVTAIAGDPAAIAAELSRLAGGAVVRPRLAENSETARRVFGCRRGAEAYATCYQRRTSAVTRQRTASLRQGEA